MQPCHQRHASDGGTGGDHVANCATDPGTCPNRTRFGLTVNETRAARFGGTARPGDTGDMTVGTTLPEVAAAWTASPPSRPFGIYVHVPFCASRCGYCDFNTYTPAELGGANPDGWL